MKHFVQRGVLGSDWEASSSRRVPATVCLGVAVALLTAAADASASHYYAEVGNGSIPAGDADEGAQIDLETDTLVSACGSNFVDHEMWYGVVSGGAYWVEAGVTTGVSGGSCYTRTVFWADNRNGGGYHEHMITNVGWSSGFYDVQIVQHGSVFGTWDVYFGGLQIGTSASNYPGAGRFLEAGIESTISGSSQQVRGWTLSREMYDSTSTWRAGWDNSGLYNDAPAIIGWEDSSDDETKEVLNVAF